MKKIIVSFFISIIFFGCSNAVRTTITPEEKYLNFIETLSKDKSQIFEAVEEWIIVNATDANRIIQLRDKESGKIIVKAVTKVTVGLTKLPMNYILIIRMSDNKIEFNYEIGEMASYYGGYPPASSIDEIKNEFILIKDSILNKITNYSK